MVKITRSESETELFGEELSRKLKPGDWLALVGPLGAGKTAFVRGICRGLGCTIDVSSPTFSIINFYPGNVNVAHVDLYRIEEDFESIGWDDLFEPDKVIIIEWAEKVKNHLPDKRIDVFFSVIDFNTRQIKLEYCNDSGN